VGISYASRPASLAVQWVPEEGIKEEADQRGLDRTQD